MQISFSALVSTKIDGFNWTFLKIDRLNQTTPWPYLTFIVGTLVQSSQCRHQILVYGAVWLRPNSPECRYNVQVLPTRVRLGLTANYTTVLSCEIYWYNPLDLQSHTLLLTSCNYFIRYGWIFLISISILIWPLHIFPLC